MAQARREVECNPAASCRRPGGVPTTKVQGVVPPVEVGSAGEMAKKTD